MRAQPALTTLDSGVTMPATFDVVTSAADAEATTWRLVLPVAPDAVQAWADAVLGDVGRLTAVVTTAGGPVTVALADAGVTAATMRAAAVGGQGVLNTLATHAGGSTVEPSPELLDALDRANALQLLLRGARPLAADDVGTDRTPAAPLVTGLEPDRVVARRRPRAAGGRRRRPSGAGRARRGALARAAVRRRRPRQVVVSIGDLPAGPVTGMLLDGWNEATPGTTATTGVAIHYDAAASRAPQSILVVSPPNPAAGWSVDDVEAAVAETADLAQVRMVRPGAATGALLPATYLADNTSGEVVSTNFTDLGVIMQMVSS